MTRKKGTYPSEAKVEQDLKEFESVLKKNDSKFLGRSKSKMLVKLLPAISDSL